MQTIEATMQQFTDTERQRAESVYEEVETSIGRQVLLFQRKYSYVHPTDALSAAGLAFVEAVRSYNPDKGTMKAWVSLKVDKALKSELRRTAQRNNKRPTVDTTGVEVPEPIKDERFWLDEWLATLSADARQVAMMVFDRPFSVDVAIAELGGYETPETIRYGMREHLRDQGWTKRRIEEAFDEVKRCL